MTWTALAAGDGADCLAAVVAGLVGLAEIPPELKGETECSWYRAQRFLRRHERELYSVPLDRPVLVKAGEPDFKARPSLWITSTPNGPHAVIGIGDNVAHDPAEESPLPSYTVTRVAGLQRAPHRMAPFAPECGCWVCPESPTGWRWYGY